MLVRRAGRARGLEVAPIALAGVLLLVLAGSGPVSGPAATGRGSARAKAARAVERSALAFLPEPGLRDPNAEPGLRDGSAVASRFVARGPGYGIAVAPDEVRVAGPSSPAPLRMRLVGARPDVAGRGELPAEGRTNLILGDDPAGWRTGVASFGRVTYEGVWDGIDVVYHGRGAQLEQDFVVAPGADPDAISVSFADARELRLDANGDLVVTLAGGEARLERPTLYQDVGGRRRPVAGAFALVGDGRVGFRVGDHDRSRPLVIDPVLLDSTYLGGTGSDSAYDVAVDDAGNVYVTGFSESANFPIASPQQGRLVEEAGVRTDAFVAKLNPNGDGFVYSTFLGGKARDAGHAIAVAVDGSAVVAGYTESADFPLARPIQKTFGGGPSDAFVARISPEGAVLQYSTYLGGTGTDTARGLAVSQSGDAYVAGTTTSGDFPMAGTPVRSTLSAPDDSDAFVTRVNSAGSALVYSTYLGGNGEDHGLGVALDPVGNAYLVGDTRAPDLPTVNAFQPGLGGGTPGVGGANADAFVSKLDPNGTALLYSTYLGGTESDQGAGIAVDGAGNAYVTGSTGSTNFPVVRPAQPRKNGDFDAFVAKLSPDGPLFWSTYLGGSASDGGGGVAVDAGGRASVTGAAASTDFPTVKPFQASKAGGFVDGFVATYDEAGAGLTQSSYLGGREDDQGTSIAVDGDGILHVTGYTNSDDFPTAKPFQPAEGGGGGDVFVSEVGEPVAAPEAGGASSSPARERRIRIFLGITIVLFLAAIGQTLWLRRRPAVGPPAPAGVGDLAVTRVGPAPDWYAANRPPPPRLRDIAPVGPRPVPPPPPPPRRPRATPRTGPPGPGPGEVVVPDLLPEGDGGVWAPKPEPAPAGADADVARAEADTAPVPVVDADLPPAPPPIDVAAPDLWGPSEPEPELADDSVWWELLGADPDTSASFPPPPRSSAAAPPVPPPPPPELDAVADPAVADALAAESPPTTVPPPPIVPAAPEPRARAKPAKKAAAKKPAKKPAAKKAPVPPLVPPPQAPPAIPPPPPPPPAPPPPPPAPPPPPPAPPPPPQVPPAPELPRFEPEAPVASGEPEPAEPEPTADAGPRPGPAKLAETAASPAEPDVEPEILVSAPPERDEAAVLQEATRDDDDWTAALWGPPGPALDEPEDAGLGDAPEDERAGDLSISDLLAEDLPIPEAEEEVLSIRDLLAENLVVPEPEPALADEPTVAEASPELAAEAPLGSDAPEPAPQEPVAAVEPVVAEAEPAPEEPVAALEPVVAEAEPPGADEGPTAPADGPTPATGDRGADGDGDEPPPGGGPPGPPPERPSRPLPEAAPGRSLGGRLRRAWQSHGRES